LAKCRTCRPWITPVVCTQEYGSSPVVCQQESITQEVGLFDSARTGMNLLFVGTRGGDAFAFGDDNGLAGGHVCQLVALPAGPANLDAFGFGLVAEAKRQHQLASRQVARAAVQHL